MKIDFRLRANNNPDLYYLKTASWLVFRYKNKTKPHPFYENKLGQVIFESGYYWHMALQPHGGMVHTHTICLTEFVPHEHVQFDPEYNQSYT